MCGIAGILDRRPGATVDRDRVVRMRDALVHRGPDDAGVLVDGPVGLGHRRLSIVDVAGGHQPLANEDESIWIVFNGEIYNHAEIRPELEAKGHVYRTRSDTETIVHLYEEEGERAVERLRGMFAFALWDRPRGRLLLARDRLGIKPLYLRVGPEELVFGSEIKAILAADATRPALAPEGLNELLATGFLAGEATLFAGVRRLLPGRTLVLDVGSAEPRERRWWNVPGPATEPARPVAVEAEALRGALEEAVTSHLMSDVPLGTFLSGGLDSTAITALARPHVEGRLHTFAVGYDDAEASELAFAKIAADAIGTEHHEVVLAPETFLARTPELVWHEDEPIAFPSSVALNAVSRLAAEHVKVVLTGEGADELFLGYNRYRVAYWNLRLGRPWAAVPGTARRAIARAVRGLPSRLGRYASRTFLAFEPTVEELFFENFSIFPRSQRAALLAPLGDAAGDDPFAVGRALFDEAEGDLLQRLSAVELQSYLVELLMKQDQMSMAASIESRVPFLDHPIVERAARLPGTHRLRGWRTKHVLREAIAEIVPPVVLQRPKKGFPTPLGAWFRGPLRGALEATVLGERATARGLVAREPVRRLVGEHLAGTRDHAQRLWLLLNLELWQRIFLDGEPTADVSRGLAA